MAQSSCTCAGKKNIKVVPPVMFSKNSILKDEKAQGYEYSVPSSKLQIITKLNVYTKTIILLAYLWQFFHTLQPVPRSLNDADGIAAARGCCQF